MIQPLVIGNWKMNGSYAANYTLLTHLLPEIAVNRLGRVALCPPFPYLAQVGERLVGSSIGLGAQNVSARPCGAHTGEVSVLMLRELGCDYVLVGHSERRALHGEDDATVAAKFVAAEQAGLVPVLCVGETLEERNAGVTEAVITGQLEAVVDLAGIGGFSNAVVAYEPVWAIGTGETASPEQAQQVHEHIRSVLSAHDARLAAGLPLLYGGSVKAGNAAELFRQPDVNGGLIGGAALDAKAFIAICDAMEQSHRERLAQSA